VAPIPIFPDFRRLAIGDRPVIEACTRRFPPYADYSFTSLWCWVASCAISLLHGNLVVRFEDYETGEPFYSFLGDEAVAETALTLLARARAEGLPARLQLVPEAVVAADAKLSRLVSIEQDRDNFDYLYATEDWTCLPGSAFKRLRYEVARCRRQASLDFHLLDLQNTADQSAMTGLFHAWAERKPAHDGQDHTHELTAFRRLFDLAGHRPIEAWGFSDGRRLIAFSVSEVLAGGDCAVIHFQKTDWSYPGLASWLCHEEGRRLSARSCPVVNLEQDLGVAGLRRVKLARRPCGFLQKFVITNRIDSMD
jgi:hypothetical protein